MAASAVVAPPAAAAGTATVTDVADPDAYTAATCGQSGYIDFERYTEGENLSVGAINGVQFTTTGGYTWVVGDWTSGLWNGKYPAGSYTSQGNRWAWLGPSQGIGRIDFVSGHASVISVLTSNGTNVQLDAYDSSDQLLVTAGSAAVNTGTGHMAELRITRDAADIAYVLVHDSGDYFLVDSVCTDASGVPQSTLYDWKQAATSQGPTAWAGQTLFNDTTDQCWTMARGGCAITALADVVASYGLLQLPNGQPTNPGNLNQYLAANGSTHSTCYIKFTMAASSLGFQQVKDLRPDSSSVQARIDLVNSSLAAGDLVIAGLTLAGGGTHFVVIYAAPATPGSTDYPIVDPAWTTNSTLESRYGGTGAFAARNPQIVVIHNKTGVPGRKWTVVAHSPISILVTAPDGKQTGWDPVSGTIKTEIPDSWYGTEPGLEDDSGLEPPMEGTLVVELGERLDGDYHIEVTGTGSGPYRMDSLFGGDSPSESTIEGTAAPGVTETFLVTGGGGGGGVPPAVTKVWNVNLAKTGSGAGAVTSDAIGLDCGATCAADFADGSPVTLTATPVTGAVFTGWSGDVPAACTLSPAPTTCTIPMDGVKAVTATFTDVAAPTVSAVAAPTLIEASQLTGTRGTLTPLHVTWTASDTGGSGVASVTLSRSSDGTHWVVVGSPLAGGQTAADVAVPAGTRYLRATAVDGAGHTTVGAASPSRIVSLVQQTATTIAYGGTWKKATSGALSGGTAKYATAARAWVSYTFTGRSVAVVTTKALNRGRVKVYLDGKFVTTVDLRAATTSYRVVGYQKSWGAAKRHTIKLVVVGTAGRPRVDLDAFVVLR